MNLVLNRDLDPIHYTLALHTHTQTHARMRTMHSSRSLVVTIACIRHSNVAHLPFQQDIIPYHSIAAVTGNRHTFFLHIRTIVCVKSDRNPETIGTGRAKEKHAPRSTDRAYIGIQTCLCVSMRVPLMNVHWIV